MLARHLRRARTAGAGASCVHRRCYSSEQWSRLESKAMAIVQGLEQQGQTVGVAELASGGLISAGDCRRSNLSPPATSPDPGLNPGPNHIPRQLCGRRLPHTSASGAEVCGWLTASIAPPTSRVASTRAASSRRR